MNKIIFEHITPDSTRRMRQECENLARQNTLPHIGTDQIEEEPSDECGGNGSVCGVLCDYCEGDGYIEC